MHCGRRNDRRPRHLRPPTPSKCYRDCYHFLRITGHRTLRYQTQILPHAFLPSNSNCLQSFDSSAFCHRAKLPFGLSTSSKMVRLVRRPDDKVLELLFPQMLYPSRVETILYLCYSLVTLMCAHACIRNSAAALPKTTAWLL